jgi:hypothetical protein
VASVLSKLIKSMKTKYSRIILFAKLGLLNNIEDEKYLKTVYKARFGKDLNLTNPITYNEKLQWLKLYDHREIYTTMADKYEAKLFATEKIGAEYIIPTLGVWENFDDINFSELPESFVLKCTHDSGGLCICKNKKEFDIKKAKKKINFSMRKNYFYEGREWSYKNIKPRIIAEAFMEDKETNELRDYKFFTFNGVPKYMFIASERQDKSTDTKFDFFDMDFNHIELINEHENAVEIPSKPVNFEKMKELAAILSEGIPHLRVDFYEVNGHIYFGELTVYHWSGFSRFNPEKWDLELGKLLVLPEKKIIS